MIIPTILSPDSRLFNPSERCRSTSGSPKEGAGLFQSIALKTLPKSSQFRSSPKKIILIHQSKTSLVVISWCLWANYNNSLTWIKAIWGWFPLLTMISRVRSQWGRYNLPRCLQFVLQLLVFCVTANDLGSWENMGIGFSSPIGSPVRPSTVPRCEPWCWNISLHLHQKWPSSVGKYSSTMVRIWGISNETHLL